MFKNQKQANLISDIKFPLYRYIFLSNLPAWNPFPHP